MNWRNNVKSHPLVWLIAGGLAAWRLASILHKEKIAAPIRKAVGVEELGNDPEYWMYPDTFFGELISCEWCLSVWTGGLVTALLGLFPPAIIPFSLSALSILYKKHIEEEPELVIVETGEDQDGTY